MSNDRILFRCGQWVVTTYGMEVADDHAKKVGRYDIEAARLDELTERGTSGKMYDWPVHLAGKGWVNREDFLTAFAIALLIHADKYDTPPDGAILARTIGCARKHWVFDTAFDGPRPFIHFKDETEMEAET